MPFKQKPEPTICLDQPNFLSQPSFLSARPNFLSSLSPVRVFLLSRCLPLTCGPHSSALSPPSLLDATRWDQGHCALIIFPETEHCGRPSCAYRRHFHATSPPF